MSIFVAILAAVGLNDNEAKAAEALAPVKIPVNESAPAPAPAPAPASAPTASSAAAVGVVDVVAQLEAKAAAHAEKLNWKVSIVDLMKLLGLDSSFGARKELAVELGCPAEKMSDSAQMNMWLHKSVLQKIADNGGDIPQDLLS